jgi:hypothetical protein
MSRILGNNSPLGIILKQKLTPDSLETSFALDFQVKIAESLLVILDGSILEPKLDYNVNSSGTELVFSSAPASASSLYILYLGREITVPSTQGNELIRKRFTGDDLETNFPLSLEYVLFEEGVLVFVDGTQQPYGDVWTIDNNTHEIVFVTAPTLGQTIDVYIQGVERNDIFVLEDGSVTREKLNLDWDFNSNGDFFPKNNNVRDLGTNLKRPRDSYLTDVDVSGNITIQGNLEVLGTQTIFNTDILDIEDNEITINSNFTTGSPSIDGGFRFKRGDSSDALIQWDESGTRWQVGTEGSLEEIAYDSDLQNHITDTLNPHAVTKSQVGLGSVTNDAQLKRGDGDFDTFGEKLLPVSGDLLLIEDSESSLTKKKLTFGNLESSLSLTSSQVGLGSVTNDAQLKRSAGDFLTFDEKTDPVIADVVLIEDSEDSDSKKYASVESILALSPSTLWVSVSTSQTAQVNYGYVISGSASQVELLLPATSSVGDVIEITSADANGWRVTQSAGQSINFTSVTTTVGSSGYIQATQQNDSIKLVCVADNSTWNVVSSMGNIEIV